MAEPIKSPSLLDQLSGMQDGAAITVSYVGAEGAMIELEVLPTRLWFGRIEAEQPPGWLIEGWDLENQMLRSFHAYTVSSWQASASPLAEGQRP